MKIARLCTKKPSRAVDFAFSFSAGGGWGGVNVIQKPAVETRMQGTFINRSMDKTTNVKSARMGLRTQPETLLFSGKDEAIQEIYVPKSCASALGWIWRYPRSYFERYSQAPKGDV